MVSQTDITGNKAIKINSVRKAFSLKQILKGVSFEVDCGESVCMCGINGVGKSTLMRIVSGLLEPDSGNVELCGYDIKKDSDKTKAKLGVISHKSMLYPNLTAFENLSFFAALYGVSDSKNRVKDLLEEAGLYTYRYEKAGILSRGQLQRLAIARATVHRPKVLLADEPFTGLDKSASEYLIEKLNTFVQDGGSVLMTTHDTELSFRCCGRMIVLDGGDVIFDQPGDKINIGEFSKDYLSYARKIE